MGKIITPSEPLILLAHKTECACAQFDYLDAYLRSADMLIAKAASVSEVAQIARIEVRLRKALIVKWQARSEQAARTAESAYKSGASLASALGAAVKVIDQWPGDVEDNFKQSLEDVYKLARRAGHRKATGKSKASLQYSVVSLDIAKAKPTKPATDVKLVFDVQDERAVRSLQRQEMWWIGETSAGVGKTVRNAVEPKIMEGLSRKEGGKLVGEAVAERVKDFRIPDGFRGSASSYFEGLAANSVTLARVQGQLNSFSKIGVIVYTIVNPMDGRTSPICAELNGTEFKVAEAETQLTRLAGARTPDAYKGIKPWLGNGKIAELAAKGSGALSRAGQLFPPFHFKCRSTVDIAKESMSFSALAD